jgi:hypothetical protein
MVRVNPPDREPYHHCGYEPAQSFQAGSQATLRFLKDPNKRKRVKSTLGEKTL